MKPMIDWDKNTISLEEINLEKIPEWLKDLKEVFGKLLEDELLSRRPGMDHEIKLIQKNISSSSLIPGKPADNQLLKKYLDKMLNKGWIKTSTSALGASMFMISKKRERRLIVDY